VRYDVGRALRRRPAPEQRLHARAVKVLRSAPNLTRRWQPGSSTSAW